MRFRSFYKVSSSIRNPRDAFENHIIKISINDPWHKENHPIIEGAAYRSDLRLFTIHAHIPYLLFGPEDLCLAHAANDYVEFVKC